MADLFARRSVLLLQGPAGRFFLTLAEALASRPGCAVHKVNLNGGDEAFFPSARQRDELRIKTYTGTREEWPRWLAGFMEFRRVDALVLFGQCRPYHALAVEVARSRGVAVYVFEEGYLRPNFVTLERDGVNAYSALPRDPAFYRAFAVARSPERARPRVVPTTATPPLEGAAPADGARSGYWRMAACQIGYLSALRLAAGRFPHYRHHRCAHVTLEAARWVRGGVRKLVRRVTERDVRRRLESAELRRRFFLVPLQVHNDSQVVHHSRFGSVGEFIDEVLGSFAAHAPADVHLVFKHHPMDRAYTDYRRRIGQRAHELGLRGRVHYLDDAHLPTLLKAALGVVTINSTVGLSALLHSTPCVALGEAFYAMPGLARAGGLDGFWRDPGQVDAALFSSFRAYLLEQTQLAGSFYGEVPAIARLARPPRAGARPDPHGAVPANTLPIGIRAPVEARPEAAAVRIAGRAAG